MTAETAHHPSGPLAVALSLAAVAGFVDAFVFLNVTNVFVANMSGNLIRLGIVFGSTDWPAVAGSVAALVAFTCGVVVAIAHHDRALRQSKQLRPDQLLLVEAVLIAVLPILLIRDDVAASSDPGAVQYLIVGLGAFAMGIQASALRRVGDVAVATTYGTGTIVRIGEKLALGLTRADRVSDHRRTKTILILTGVLLAYVSGAALASALGASPWLLLIPVVVLGAIPVASARWIAGGAN